MAKNKKKSTHTKNTSNTAGAQKQRNTVEKREAKKAAVLGSQKKGHLPLIVAVVCAVLVVGAGVFYITYSPSSVSPVVAATSAPAKSKLTQTSFPVSLFEDGKARHFQHAANGLTIKFFVLKSSDGIIRAAFDACDVCWRAGKGYYQEGDHMVCRNCGRRFASVLVNEVKGGCNPAPLNRKVENGNVIIQVNDILEGKQFFNFS